MSYCRQCGAALGPGSGPCPHCGAQTFRGPPAQAPLPPQPQSHSFVVTLILCWTLGVFGVHRFYTGNTGLGIAQLLTCGGFGIWALVDFILILVGSYRDGEGRPLVHDA